MLSESTRATSAAESRFRINNPNSKPRTIKVVAMDAASVKLMDRTSMHKWTRATFLFAPSLADTMAQSSEANSFEHWMRNVVGQTTNLISEVVGTDVMVLVIHAGSDAQTAVPIGEACAMHGVPFIGLVIQDGTELNDATLQTMNSLRPITTMLVIANGEDYVELMLTALRA